MPLTYYDQEREHPVLFGVLNATRRPGAPPFTHDDLEYLTRFAGQLSIAVANSMAFAAERERSEQLALVNTLLREIAGNLSRERILETAVRRIHEAFHYPVVRDRDARRRGRARYRIVAVAYGDPGAAGRAASFPHDAGITGRALPRAAHRAGAGRRRRTPTTSRLVAREPQRGRDPDPLGRRRGGRAERRERRAARPRPRAA